MCELQCLSRLGHWKEIAEKVLIALNGDMDNWNLLKLFITARIKTALELREKEESSIRINGTTEEEESRSACGRGSWLNEDHAMFYFNFWAFTKLPLVVIITECSLVHVVDIDNITVSFWQEFTVSVYCLGSID